MTNKTLTKVDILRDILEDLSKLSPTTSGEKIPGLAVPGLICLLETIMGAFWHGQGLEVRGLGTFKVKVKRKGVTINRATGNATKNPDGRSVKFKASKDLIK